MSHVHYGSLITMAMLFLMLAIGALLEAHLRGRIADLKDE